MRTLLRLESVMMATAQSRSKIYEMMDKGLFPRPIKIGRINAWDCAEISDWMEQKFAERDSNA